MFGRERERAEIDALLDQVRAGRSRCLVVTGETGLCKITLAPLPDSVHAELLRLRARLLNDVMIRRILHECRGNPVVPT